MWTKIGLGTDKVRVVNMDNIAMYELSGNKICLSFTHELDINVFYPQVKDAQDEYDRLNRLNDVML